MTFAVSMTPDPEASQGQAEMVIVETPQKCTVDGLIMKMVGLSAFIQRLYLQSHLIHFNYECKNFLAIHKFTKKQYEQHIDQFDRTCEYIRSMDYLVPDDGKELMSYCKSFRFNKSRDPQEMLTTYARNLEDFGMMAKDLVESARDVGAPDIENFYAEVCGQSFKSAWYLKASLRDELVN